MDSRTKVSIRDFAIFQVKLLVDAAKDSAVFTISFVAFGIDLVIDLVFKRHGQRPIFYRVMRVSERVDLWLNLYGAAKGAEEDEDGLFGGSEAGSDTLLGQIEQMVRGGDEPPAGDNRSTFRPRSGSSSAGMI